MGLSGSNRRIKSSSHERLEFQAERRKFESGHPGLPPVSIRCVDPPRGMNRAGQSTRRRVTLIEAAEDFLARVSGEGPSVLPALRGRALAHGRDRHAPALRSGCACAALPTLDRGRIMVASADGCDHLARTERLCMAGPGRALSNVDRPRVESPLAV